jgi:hypothetical protein
LEVSNADGSKDLNVCSQQVRAQSLLKVCWHILYTL